MPLDIVQSVVFMAFAAAGVSGRYGTAEALTGELRAFLGSEDGPDGGGEPGFFPKYNDGGEYQLIGGDWSVVWGPVAALPPGVDGSDYVANAMYVAHSPSQDTYVVAVASTAHHSFYDWAIEDADVTWLDAVRWSKWVDGAPHDALISGGTDDGLRNLLHMQSSDGTGSKPIGLRAFLRGVDAGSRLIVTGHSLGGALSPALALLLRDDRKGGTGICVLPLAGPTPGNDGFATLFTHAFRREAEPTRPDFDWNRDIQNVHDLVPRAWDRLQSALQPPEAMTETAPALHPSIWGAMTPEVALGLKGFVDLLSALALGVRYTALDPARFDDTFGAFVPANTPNWTPWSQPPDGDAIGSLQELDAVIVASHYDQYIRHFGLIPLQPLSKTDSQLQADELVRLKKAARLAAARLTTGGLRPPSPAASSPADTP